MENFIYKLVQLCQWLEIENRKEEGRAMFSFFLVYLHPFQIYVVFLDARLKTLIATKTNLI